MGPIVSRDASVSNSECISFQFGSHVNINPSGISTRIECTAAGERHEPLVISEGPPKTPRTSRQYDTEGFQGGPQSGSNMPLVQPITKFQPVVEEENRL